MEAESKKRIRICMGMGCEGNSRELYHNLQKILKEHPEWELETVRCFGRCGKHPVISIDGEITHRLNLHQVLKKMGIEKQEK